jgi:hypothetical protein
VGSNQASAGSQDIRILGGRLETLSLLLMFVLTWLFLWLRKDPKVVWFDIE